MSHTYQEIVDAVFYAQQKPEALAALLCEALGVTVPAVPAFQPTAAETTPAPTIE